MTKNEAHERFLRWIEAHPSDEWRIVGGNYRALRKYYAEAFMIDTSRSIIDLLTGKNRNSYEYIEIKYEEEND